MSAANSPYDFTDPFAQSVLTAAKSGPYARIPGIGMSEERQVSWVEPKLKDAFMTRNPKGQTLLYCLLRFTVSNYMRNKFLYYASIEQLATKNTNCGSTALMGFVYGEYEKPRMVDECKMKNIIDEANKYTPGIIDILAIPNNQGETCYTFYNHIIQWQQ